MATYLTLDQVIGNTKPEVTTRDPEEEKRAREKAIMEKIAQEYNISPKILEKLENQKKEIGNLIYELEKKRDALRKQALDNESINKEISELENKIKSLKLRQRFLENARHYTFWAIINLWNAIEEEEKLKI